MTDTRFYILANEGDSAVFSLCGDWTLWNIAQLERMLGMQSVANTSTLHSRQRSSQMDVGETIDDFDLLIKLGSGAFATVFLARQRSLQRLVALKVAANQADEPQTLAQLDHPHIVRVFDQRILPERGLHLLYMHLSLSLLRFGLKLRHILH